MNRIYPNALDEIGRALLDLETAPLTFLLLDDSYTFDAAHLHLDEIDAGARIGDPQLVAGTRLMTAGNLISDTETTTLVAVPVDVDEVAAVVMYDDSGTESTSRLVAYWTQQADTAAIVVVTDGGDVVLTFPTGRLMRI